MSISTSTVEDVNKEPDLVTRLAGVGRHGRRAFYKDNKKLLKMTWEQFNRVIEKKRLEMYGK